MKRQTVTNVGSQLSSNLLVAFIVLKLTNTISWSWWWVLCPFWIPLVIAILFLIVAAIYAYKR